MTNNTLVYSIVGEDIVSRKVGDGDTASRVVDGLGDNVDTLLLPANDPQRAVQMINEAMASGQYDSIIGVTADSGLHGPNVELDYISHDRPAGIARQSQANPDAVWNGLNNSGLSGAVSYDNNTVVEDTANAVMNQLLQSEQYNDTFTMRLATPFDTEAAQSPDVRAQNTAIYQQVVSNIANTVDSNNNARAQAANMLQDSGITSASVDSQQAEQLSAGNLPNLKDLVAGISV